MTWDISKPQLTTGDISEMCGVNYRTVIRWIQGGLINAYQLPGNRGDNRVLVRDFLAFLRENRMPIPDEMQPLSRRVLVVDDEKVMATAIKKALDRKGLEVMIAPGGFLAGALATTFSPAIITLDLRMPCLGGIEVIRAIRDDPELTGIKVLVVPAMPQDELYAAIEAGADDAIEKPFKNTDLVARVMRLIGANKALG